MLIFESELASIARWAAAYPDLETGGSLFGYWTHSGTAVIFLAIGPGSGARHEGTAFYQDASYLTECSQLLYDAFGLQHVGEWHSHHQMHLFEPSGGDQRTVLLGMEARGWERFVIAITNLVERNARSHSVDSRFFHFEQRTRRYRECRVQRLPGASPLRKSRLALPPGEPEPETRRAPDWGIWELAPPVAPVRESWYGQRVARRRIAQEIRGLEVLEDHYGHRHALERNGEELLLHVELPDGRQSVWKLAEGYPRRPPAVQLDGRALELAWNSERLVAEHLLEDESFAAPAAAPAAPERGAVPPDGEDTLVAAQRSAEDEPGTQTRH